MNALVLLGQAGEGLAPIREGLSLSAMVIIALAVSLIAVGLVWKLGVIRFMVNVQDRQQSSLDHLWKIMDENPDSLSDRTKRFLKVYGRKSLRTAKFGTGRHAAISFTIMIWFLSFGFTFFGLMWYG